MQIISCTFLLTKIKAMRRNQRFPRGSRMAHLLSHSPFLKKTFLLNSLYIYRYRLIIFAKTTRVLRIGNEIDSACATALSLSFTFLMNNVALVEGSIPRKGILC